MPSDLIRGPAPDLIRGGDRFASRKRVKSTIWSPVSILSKRKRLRRLPLVGTSPPAVVRFKYDNRRTACRFHQVRKNAYQTPARMRTARQRLTTNSESTDEPGSARRASVVLSTIST